MKNRKGKGILTLLIFAVILTACGAGNNKQETASEDNQNDKETFLIEYEKNEEEHLILYANESVLFSDEDNEVILTVRVPSNLPFESISITDGNGEIIDELDEDNPKKTEKDYREYSIEEFFSSGQPGVRTLTASMGEAESAPLDLYFTERITIDMLTACSEAGQDLSDYLAKNNLEDLFNEGEGDKCLDAVLEWLEADDRILDAEIVGENVMYHTTDHVLGIYTPPCEDGFFGSSGGRANTILSVSFPDGYNVADALRNQETLGYPGDSDGDAIFLDGVLSRTNSKFLVLTPWEDTGDDLVGRTANFELLASGNNHLKMAEKYQSELGYTVENTGYAESLGVIIGGNLSDYGIITLMCHGATLERSDGTESVIFCWPGSANGHYGRPLFESLAEQARRSGAISEEDDFYQLFYHEGTFSADHTLMALDGGSILVGGNYIIQRYQDTFFDNTIFYTGACHGACDERLISFCIDHGMKAYIGYKKSVSVVVEPERFNRIFSNLKKVMKDGQTESIYSSSDIFTATDNLYCHAKDRDWRIIGIGSVRGKVDSLVEKVKISEDGTATTERGGEPIENAAVSFCRFMNQQFERTKTVTTGSDGLFTIDDLNWGVYGIEVDTGSGEVFYSGMTLAEDDFDAGTIHVGRSTAQIEGNVYVEGTDGQRTPAAAFDVFLTLNDEDPAKRVTRAIRGQNGRFCISDIIPGDYVLDIEAESGSYNKSMTLAMSTDYVYEKIILKDYEGYYSSPLQDYREYEEYAKNNRGRSTGFADQRQLCQIISYCVPDGAEVYYRFSDLNNDGFKELIIGTYRSNTDKLIVHDIYTKGEVGPVHVLEHDKYYNLGERYNAAFDIENNQISITGSGSAFSNYVRIYNFDEDSTEAVFFEEYMHDTATSYEWEYYHIDADRNVRASSESEFSMYYEYAKALFNDMEIFNRADWKRIAK